MEKKLTITALFLCISSLAYAAATSARTWEPGVAEGDFFYYETYGIYTSNKPNATIEVPPFERNTTEWVRIDITSVSGSVVNQTYTLHFKEGAETTFEKQTNVDPASSTIFNFTEKGIPICAGNLEVGDQLPTVKLQINGKLILTYPSGEKRETNSVAWNFTDDWGRCYFDKETGILVELCRVHLFENPTTREIVSKADVVNLTGTNMWEMQERAPTVMMPDFARANGLILPLFGIGMHRLFALRKVAPSARKERKDRLVCLHKKEK